MITWLVLLSSLVLVTKAHSHNLGSDEYYEYYEDENHHYKLEPPENFDDIAEHAHPAVSKAVGSSEDNTKVSEQKHMPIQQISVSNNSDDHVTIEPTQNLLIEPVPSDEDNNLIHRSLKNDHMLIHPHLFPNETNDHIPTKKIQEPPTEPRYDDKDNINDTENSHVTIKPFLLSNDTDKPLSDKKTHNDYEIKPVSIYDSPHVTVPQIIPFNSSKERFPMRLINKTPFKTLATHDNTEGISYANNKPKVVHPFGETELVHLADILTKNKHLYSKANNKFNKSKNTNNNQEPLNSDDSHRTHNIESSTEGNETFPQNKVELPENLALSYPHDEVLNESNLSPEVTPKYGDMSVNPDTNENGDDTKIGFNNITTTNTVNQIKIPSQIAEESREEIGSLPQNMNSVPDYADFQNTSRVMFSKDKPPLPIIRLKNSTLPLDSPSLVETSEHIPVSPAASNVIQSLSNNYSIPISDLSDHDAHLQINELPSEQFGHKVQDHLLPEPKDSSTPPLHVDAHDGDHESHEALQTQSTNNLTITSENNLTSSSFPEVTENIIPSVPTASLEPDQLEISTKLNGSMHFITPAVSQSGIHQFSNPTLSSQIEEEVNPKIEENANSLLEYTFSKNKIEHDIPESDTSEPEILFGNQIDGENASNYQSIDHNKLNRSHHIPHPVNYTIKEEYVSLPLNASGLEMLKKLNFSVPHLLHKSPPRLKKITTKIIKKRKVKKPGIKPLDGPIMSSSLQHSAGNSTSDLEEKVEGTNILNETQDQLPVSESVTQLPATETSTEIIDEENLQVNIPSSSTTAETNNTLLSPNERNAIPEEQSYNHSSEISISPENEEENSKDETSVESQESKIEDPSQEESSIPLASHQEVNQFEEYIYEKHHPGEHHKPDSMTDYEAKTSESHFNPNNRTFETTMCADVEGCDKDVMEDNNNKYNSHVIKKDEEIVTPTEHETINRDDSIDENPKCSDDYLEFKPDAVSNNVIFRDDLNELIDYKGIFEEPDSSSRETIIETFGSSNGVIEQLITRNTISKKTETISIKQIPKRFKDIGPRFHRKPKLEPLFIKVYKRQVSNK